MTPDDAAMLERFDEVLDGLVEDRRVDVNGIEAGLIDTFGRVRSATSRVSPRPDFALGLRTSLLQQTPAAPVGTNVATPIRLTSSPASKWLPSGRWWPRIELAAMLLVIGLLASLLAGGDTWRWFPDGPDDGGFVAAPGTPSDSTTQTPTALIAASTSVPQNPKIEPAPTVTVVSDQPDEGAIVRTSESQPLTATPPVSLPAFTSGDVVVTIADEVILRSEPRLGDNIIDVLANGTRLILTGDAIEEGGVSWLPVTDVTTFKKGYVNSVCVAGPVSVTPTPKPINTAVTAEPTVTAVLATQVGPTPTQVANGGFIDPSNKTAVSVNIDATGLIMGDPSAKANAVERLREVLAPYEGCLVGVALTYGWSADLGQGISVADAVNRLLKESFPEMFGHTAFESFANLRDPVGQVDLDLYFYQGCVPGSASTSTPTISTGSQAAEQTPGAVLFLIDRSGSMSYDPLGGTAKLEMEKETIRRAVGAMPEGTTIGVIAFNEGQEWAVPWTTIGAEVDRRAIVVAVDAITAEGGSELPAALTAAISHMRANVDSATKQIVLLSDGKWRGGSERFYREAIGGAVQEGFVLSAIAFGDDADTLTMQLLAELGNGRYHLVKTPEDIPTITKIDGQVVIVEGSGS